MLLCRIHFSEQHKNVWSFYNNNWIWSLDSKKFSNRIYILSSLWHSFTIQIKYRKRFENLSKRHWGLVQINGLFLHARQKLSAHCHGITERWMITLHCFEKSHRVSKMNLQRAEFIIILYLPCSGCLGTFDIVSPSLF